MGSFRGSFFLLIISCASISAEAAYFPFIGRGNPSAEIEQAMKRFSLPQEIVAERIELRDYDVYFRPLVARLLLNIEASRGEPSLPPFAECPPLLAELKAARRVCEKFSRPELLFASEALFDPGYFGWVDSMQTLEENLSVVVTPLIAQRTVFSWFDEPTSQKIRLAMLRLGFSRFEREVLELKQNLQGEFRIAALSLLAQLREINAKGVEAYREDARAVALQGRRRAPLPYQNLSDDDRRHLSIYSLGMLWRFRGGGMVDKPEGTQATRVYFAMRPFDVLARLNGYTDSGLGFDQFTRLAARGWGRWFDMGRNQGEEQESEASDLTHMTERGIYQMEGTRARLNYFSFETTPLEIGAREFGICYLFAWERLAGVLVRPDLRPPFQGFFDSPTAWGELCAGAAFGLGLADSLLMGKRVSR